MSNKCCGRRGKNLTLIGASEAEILKTAQKVALFFGPHCTAPSARSVRFSRYLAISCERALYDSGKITAGLAAATGGN